MSQKRRCTWLHRRAMVARNSGAGKTYRCEDPATALVDGLNKYGHQITWVCEDHAAKKLEEGRASR